LSQKKKKKKKKERKTWFRLEVIKPRCGDAAGYELVVKGLEGRGYGYRADVQLTP
jgi:hypothetical protein